MPALGWAAAYLKGVVAVGPAAPQLNHRALGGYGTPGEDAIGFAGRLRLDRAGVRSRPDGSGGEFAVSGVPISMGGTTIPPAPEVAVEFAFAETGSKIVDVPVLGMPGNRVTRTAARWHLRLAELMTFERIVDGQVVGSDEVYVSHFPSIADARLADSWDTSGIRLRLYVAAAMQPTVETLGSIDLPLRPGHAVDLHEVRLRE